MFTDVNGDGRPDLYVANDLDPNRLYLNLPAKGGLGFRLVEEGKRLGLDDPNAGMGIATGDFSGDGRDDLFVSNSRGQLHAVYRSRAGKPFADARPDFVGALGRTFTGWGVTWADSTTTAAELAMANGAIPITSLAKDAEPCPHDRRGDVRPLDVGAIAPERRGLAAATTTTRSVDLAVGSIGGGAAARNRPSRRPANGSRCRPALVPGALVTVVLRAAAGWSRRRGPGRATSPPRTRGSTSAWARRRASTRSSSATRTAV